MSMISCYIEMNSNNDLISLYGWNWVVTNSICAFQYILFIISFLQQKGRNAKMNMWEDQMNSTFISPYKAQKVEV